MTTQSYEIAPQLFLVRQEVAPRSQVSLAPTPTHHILVLDCSGSMHAELPKIRGQLKKKLPKLLREKDILSIIWFSGKGEYGVLLEAEEVATAKDLTTINNSIDRWLRPVGLTGFLQPLQAVGPLVDRHPGYSNSLFFMSDGHDNCSNRADILKSLKDTIMLAAATFVEYGYYADRPLLAKMAEVAGGTLVFAEHFDKYEPELESALTRGISGAPRIEVTPASDLVVETFCFTIADGCLSTYGVEDGKVRVPEDTEVIYYLSPKLVGDTGGPLDPQSKGPAVAAFYAAVSLFSVRMRPNIVLPLLKVLGDVAFIEQFGSCFGKQRYSAFMDAAKEAALNPDKRLVKGYDPSKVPADDAFTVFDLLRILAADKDTRLLLDHSAFRYNRIGRARVDANTVLTAEEQEEVTQLTEAMAKERDVAKLKDLQVKLAAITDKPAALKFEAAPSPDGYGISNLTYNEEKPNISVLVRKTGTVDLTARLPDNLKGTIPTPFSTFVFRNYAIVKDGLVNVAVLPVKISDAVRKQLPSEIVSEVDGVTIIKLGDLPTVNRQMVKDASAKALFELEYALTKARAEQKVYNTYRKDLLGGKKSEGFVEQYGQEAADWLKEQGFTDYSGFGPKQVQADASDFYMAKEMAVSLKGYSTLPSLKDVKEKQAKGKLNATGALMAPTVDLVEGFLKSDAYLKAKDQPAVLAAWLDGQAEGTITETRRLIREKAQQLFTIIVGQTWFVEFSSIDENTLDLDLDGNKVTCKVEMKEVKVLL